MGRWHRHPKRLNLKYLLRDSACEFIFDASQTSADEFLELQRSLSPIYAPNCYSETWILLRAQSGF
jgi:hypothetical protein